jgi:RNA polymerase sigma factor for flagellar operon FliA
MTFAALASTHARTPRNGSSPRSAAVPVPSQALVANHLWLVASETRRMARRLPGSLRAEDLVGSGCMGLLAAVERFDPNRGAEFSAFARLKIRAAMLDELRELDLLPRRARATLNKVERARRSFLAAHTREPTREELASAAQMTNKALDDVLALGERVHTHEPIERAETTVPDLYDSTDHTEHRETVVRLGEAISRLNERHQQVLHAYYQGDMTFREIGTRWGVTESRICQLHAEAVRELRGVL